MSVIQPILERMQHSCDPAASPLPSDFTVPVESPSASLRNSQLGCHATWYRENLGQCNEPMLQVEWAWMHGRISSLRHCFNAGQDAEAAVDNEPSQDDARLAELLLQTQLFRTLLLQEFCSRGLKPMPPRGTVLQEWGIL